MALVLPDRIARVAVAWVCFQALGGDAGLGVITTGFAVGVAVGVMSMVPGGLGVQEGSMAGTYHLLGVPLEEAVLAAMLFRAVYYWRPLRSAWLFTEVYCGVRDASQLRDNVRETEPLIRWGIKLREILTQLGGCCGNGYRESQCQLDGGSSHGGV